MIADFKGFRGHAALCQIGKVEFLILAKNPKQLQAIYDHIMQNDPPFNFDACRKSIVIQSTLLPKPTEKKS